MKCLNVVCLCALYRWCGPVAIYHLLEEITRVITEHEPTTVHQFHHMLQSCTLPPTFDIDRVTGIILNTLHDFFDLWLPEYSSKFADLLTSYDIPSALKQLWM